MRSDHNVLGVSSVTFCSMALFCLLAVEYSNLWYTAMWHARTKCLVFFSFFFLLLLNSVCAACTMALLLYRALWLAGLLVLFSRVTNEQVGSNAEGSSCRCVTRRPNCFITKVVLFGFFCGLFRLLLFSHREGTSMFVLNVPRHHLVYFLLKQPLVE